MHRQAMKKLIGWNNSKRRKPLILEGARQVGKTWLALEFGRTQFAQTAHVVFLDNERMRSVFEGSLDPARLLDAISAETGVRVGGTDTLMIFDEVQECPRALTSLKLFHEQRPDVPIIAAGSLLGVALHKGASFPVGKVDHLNLDPMTFQEFLIALGEDALVDLLEGRNLDLMDAFSEKFIDRLKEYCFVGGMPEAVAEFAETRDLMAARRIQEQLLYDYEHDFSKHADGALAERIRDVWRSAPSQLARENRRFIYSAVRSGGRARKYEEAIRWLIDAGLLVRVSRIAKPNLPLSSYEDINTFKLYLLDVGLLGAASRLDARTVIEGRHLFSEFKGALTEQYVCQQLVAERRIKPHYWSAANSSGEIDFIYEYGNTVVPIEVKAEENLRAKSLAAFSKKYHIERSLRLSLSGWRDQGWLVNVPLYAANLLPDVFCEHL